MRVRVLGEVNEKSCFFDRLHKTVLYRINTIKYSEIWLGETSHSNFKEGDSIYVPELDDYCIIVNLVKNIEGGICLFTNYQISCVEDKESHTQALNDQRKYEEKLSNDNKKELPKYNKSQINKILEIFI